MTQENLSQHADENEHPRPWAGKPEDHPRPSSHGNNYLDEEPDEDPPQDPPP